MGRCSLFHAVTSKVSDIPGNDGKPVAAPVAAPAPKPEPSFTDKFKAGAQTDYALVRNIIPGIAE